MFTMTFRKRAKWQLALSTLRDPLQLARDYAGAPDPELWRALCRAKATLDALLRCAR
jgi:hypothetical protein